MTVEEQARVAMRRADQAMPIDLAEWRLVATDLYAACDALLAALAQERAERHAVEQAHLATLRLNEEQYDELKAAEQARDKYLALWTEQGKVSRDYRERAQAAEAARDRLRAALTDLLALIRSEGTVVPYFSGFREWRDAAALTTPSEEAPDAP